MNPAEGRVREWRENPLKFVNDVFHATPDPWQAEALLAFPTSPRLAMKAAKGPGKTALLAWCSWNFLLTRPHPKIAATSISGDNLRDNLWAELAHWRNKSELLKTKFEWAAERIFAKDHPETWWMAARTWSRSADASQQGNTLAGLHADYVMAILDESGGIPDAVMANAEGIGSSAVEYHIVQAGNPTMLSGPLYRACTKERHLWKVIEISGDPDDPKRSPRISIQWAREQIEKYGRDHPFVLVNVFGKFPPTSLLTLISPEEVLAAMKRTAAPADVANSPATLGVDVARGGLARSVIFPVKGKQALKPTVKRNIDSIQGAGLVAQLEDEHGAASVFVDNTGGFGAGWVDQLRAMGRAPVPVEYAGKPNDPRYGNKRTEMYFDGTQWIKDGGCLPDEPELVAELSTPTYFFRGDKVYLIEKDQVASLIGRSPDLADAFVENFAQPVTGGGVFRHGWKVWKAPENDPKAAAPNCEVVLAAVGLDIQPERTRWCVTVWGIFDSGGPQSIVLHCERGDGSAADLTARLADLWTKRGLDRVLIPKHTATAKLYRALHERHVLVQRMTYDGKAGPQLAGEMVTAGKVWVPERQWAHRMTGELRRYPAGDAAVVVHSASLALAWLRQYGALELYAEPNDEENPDDEPRKTRKPVYG